MFKYTSFLIITIILMSCNDITQKETDLFFTRDKFINKSQLIGEHIKFDAGLVPLRYYLLKDSLIFVENLRPNPFCFDIYGLKSKKHILSFGQKGKGPFEYLTPKFINNSGDKNYFSVKDLSTQQLAVYNIDSLIVLKDNYFPKRFNCPDPVKDYYLISNKTILGYNEYYFKYNKIRNNLDTPFLKVDLNNPLSNKQYINDSKYFTANASGGYVAYNSNNEQSYVAYHYEDKFEIYNKNLELIIRLIGPDGIMPQYEEREDYSISTERDKYHRAYYDLVLGKKAIFLLYVGYNGVSYDGIMRKNVEIFKIGFDGQLRHHYQLDRLLISFSLDSNEEYLYGTEIEASNIMGESRFVRFKLD